MLNVRKGDGRCGPRPFRYESRWAKMEGFREVVEKGWRVKQNNGDPWMAVKVNLQSCRGAITQWVRKETKISEALIQSKTKKLDELQSA